MHMFWTQEQNSWSQFCPSLTLMHILKLFSKVGIQIENSTRSISSTFQFSCVCVCKIVSHCGFNFYFLQLLKRVSIFSRGLGRWQFLFWEATSRPLAGSLPACWSFLTASWDLLRYSAYWDFIKMYFPDLLPSPRLLHVFCMSSNAKF